MIIGKMIVFFIHCTALNKAGTRNKAKKEQASHDDT